MFTAHSRIFVSVLCAVLGVVAIANDVSAGVLLLAGSVVIAAGYLRYGSVDLAFRAYRRGEFARMSQMLAKTHPEKLSPSHAAYYRFLKGVEAQIAGDHYGARTLLEPGASGQLRTPKIRAIALLHLAESEFCVGDADAARILIGVAKNLTPDAEVQRLADEMLSRRTAA